MSLQNRCYAFTGLLRKRDVFLSLLILLSLQRVDAVCTPDCLRGLCLSIKRHGETTEVCECGVFYEGVQCQSVNLNYPDKQIGSTYISFSWNKNLYSEDIPDLDNFIFLFYLRDSENMNRDFSIQQPTVDVTKPAEVTLSGLTSGGNAYVVCFVHNSTDFHNLTESDLTYLTHEDRRSCLSFRTGYDANDPFTKAAISVAIALSVALGLIFFVGVICECRKNKVGKKIRRSLRSSWKLVMLDHYAESKQRVAKRQLNVGDDKTGMPNSGFVLSIPENREQIYISKK